MVWIWIGFVTFVLALLALDLGVFHRRSHEVGVREALGWSGVWIALGLSFAVFVFFAYQGHWLGLGLAADPVDGLRIDGASAAEKYLTGYVVEKSLSLDNVFVIATIFGFLAVPRLYQHRVLFWGILGALAMRGAMIAIGARLIATFHWVLQVFALFLIVTAVRMLFFRAGHAGPDMSRTLRWIGRRLPVTARFHGPHFTVRAGRPASREPETPGGPPVHDPVVDAARPGARLLTPLAVSLVMVEITDLIFAVDSIPAIFAITGDTFLVFTSNVFAMLGLRSLYFAVAGAAKRFRHLNAALAIVLLIVGLKMLFAAPLKAALGEAFNLVLLAVVLLVLAGGIAASVWIPPGTDRSGAAGGPGPEE